MKVPRAIVAAQSNESRGGGFRRLTARRARWGTSSTIDGQLSPGDESWRGGQREINFTYGLVTDSTRAQWRVGCMERVINKTKSNGPTGPAVANEKWQSRNYSSQMALCFFPPHHIAAICLIAFRSWPAEGAMMIDWFAHSACACVCMQLRVMTYQKE